MSPCCVVLQVMFERDPASRPPLDPTAELVRRIENAAEKVERTDPMHSMRLYKLAQRLRDGRVSHDAARTAFAEMNQAKDGEETDTDTELQDEEVP